MNMQIVPLDQNLIKPAFELVTRVFVSQSTLHHALGSKLGTYREYLYPSFLGMVEKGLSVAAINMQTRQVLGCAIVTDLADTDPNAEIPDTVFAPVAALTSSLCRAYRSHRSFGSGEVALLDMAGVDPRWTGHGIYTKLRSAAQERARQKGYEFIVGELSSAATQHVVLEQFGHKVIARQNLAEFEFQNTHPFANIQNPKEIILAEGNLRASQ